MSLRRIVNDGAFEEVTEELQECLKRNRVVKSPLARIQNHKQKKSTGKPFRYSPKQLFNGINRYFSWCELNDRVPSIKGLMLHLKMGRALFYTYIEREQYKDILEQAKLVMNEWVENDIYQTPGQAAGKIAYAKNVWNWADKVDTTNVNENRNTTVLTVEDAKAKIASLAHLINPQLLEDIHNRYLLTGGTREEVIEAETE